MSKKNFAQIGAAEYIVPRHMKTIKELGNNLLAVLDSNDNVVIIDSYFPQGEFFTEFKRFDRHIEKIEAGRNNLDYVSIESQINCMTLISVLLYSIMLMSFMKISGSKSLKSICTC